MCVTNIKEIKYNLQPETHTIVNAVTEAGVQTADEMFS